MSTLLTYERQYLAQFILMSQEQRIKELAQMERNPGVSGPLLIALRAAVKY